MGVGPAIFWAVASIGALGLSGAWLTTSIRDRIRARRKSVVVMSVDLSDTIDEQIAAAELLCRTELRAAPVIGVPYAAVRSDGSHDLYPHMSDAARDVCIGYLETLLSLPDAERAA